MCPFSACLFLFSMLLLLRVHVYPLHSSLQIFWTVICSVVIGQGSYPQVSMSRIRVLYFSLVFRDRSVDRTVDRSVDWTVDRSGPDCGPECGPDCGPEECNVCWVCLQWMFVRVLFSLFTTDPKYVQLSASSNVKITYWSDFGDTFWPV